MSKLYEAEDQSIPRYRLDLVLGGRKLSCHIFPQTTFTMIRMTELLLPIILSQFIQDTILVVSDIFGNNFVTIGNIEKKTVHDWMNKFKKNLLCMKWVMTSLGYISNEGL